MKIKKINVFKNNKEYSTLKFVLVIISAVIMLFNIAISSSALAVQTEEFNALKNSYSIIKLDFRDLTSNSTTIHIAVDILEEDGLIVEYYESLHNSRDPVFIQVPQFKKIRVSLFAGRTELRTFVNSVVLNKRYFGEVRDGDFYDRIYSVSSETYSIVEKEHNTHSNLSYYMTSDVTLETTTKYYLFTYLKPGPNMNYYIPRAESLHNYYNFNYLNEI